ncbi:cytochrome P450 [Chlamydoabsidia padenii]|nr:cytochrome P450 [Chlamydoabsidia padenii]
MPIQQAVTSCSDYLTQVIDWNGLSTWYERQVEKATDTITKSSKAERVTIGVAVGLVLMYVMYNRTAKPPKKLRHIPYINYFTSTRRYIIDKWPTYKLSQELNMPMLRHSPMYLRNEKFGWTVYVCTPDTAKQVFLKQDIFPKLDQSSASGSIVYRLVGVSNIVFETSEVKWKRHRKLANPAFHRSMPIKLFGETAQKLFTLLDKEQSNDFTVNVGELFNRVTLDVIGRAGFGFDFNAIADKNSPWRLVYDTVINGHRDPLFHLFPILEKHFLWMFPKRQQIHQELTKFLGMMQGIIEHKRRVLKKKDVNNDPTEDAEKDLLTLMIESELRGEGILTDQELLNDIGVFFVAGHDTTSAALTACCYYMAKYPEIQSRAREEVNRILCPNGVEPGVDVLPTAEQTKDFVYLNQIIRESLRMNGPINSLVTPRKTTKDVMLNDTLIPKGTLVNVNIYDLHHNPDVWDDPETFNPDRFAPEAEAELKAGGGMSWVPFSSGSRICIGQNFSLAEQRVLLSCLLRKYTWELPHDSIHKERLVTTNSNLLISHNVNIRFHKRY